MILVVVNKKKCVFFLFFRNFSVFLFFLSSSRFTKRKERAEERAKIEYVT
jgi:hypothetical protein